MIEKMIELDEKAFIKCYEYAKNHEGFRKAMSFITLASSKVFAAIYLSFAAFLLYRKNEKLIMFLALPLIVLVIVSLLRNMINRTRPFDRFSINSSVKHESGGSFPSKHSSSATIIALAITWIVPPLGIALLVTALATALSRVFTGLHYPLDVAAGIVISALVGLFYLFT